MRCSKKLFTELLPTSTIPRNGFAPVLTTLAGDLYHTLFRPGPATRILRARPVVGIRPRLLHAPEELPAPSGRLLPGPKEHEQPQNRDVDPPERPDSRTHPVRGEYSGGKDGHLPPCKPLSRRDVWRSRIAPRGRYGRP